MSQLAVLRPDQIDSFEDNIRPFVTSACLTCNGRWTADHILGFARKGIWQIWLVYDGDRIVFVGATEIVTFPTGLKSFAIRFGVGSGRKEWQHHIDRVLLWGKDLGCTIAEGNFRKGWRRVLPGWRHSHEFLERELT